MSEALRWGVLGSGGIARRRTIREGIVPADNAALVAAFDVDPRVNADVAGQFGMAACSSERELLARDDVEAVYVATPAHLHHAQVLAAAAAGKHVLCEKPLGLTIEQARDMIGACEAAGVKLGVGFMMRFHSQHVEALRLIEAGRLGRLAYGRAQLSCCIRPSTALGDRCPPSAGAGR